MKPYRLPSLVCVLSITGALASLPPPECVRMVREGRIAGMADRAAEARETLARAMEACPGEVSPIVALLDHYRRFETPAADVARLRLALSEWLADTDREIPAGTLEFLVENPDATQDELRLIVDSLQSRLAARPEDPGLLRAELVLRLRLEEAGKAHVAVRKALEVQEDRALVFECLELDRERGDWEEAVGHLRKLVEENPAIYRMALIEALGKAGKFDEIMPQVELVREQIDVYYGAAGTFGHLLVDVAWSLRDQGRDAEAEAVFRRVLDLDAENQDARRAILYLYSSDEERRAHEAHLAERWSEETDPYQLLTEGANKLASQDFEGAYELLRRAAEGLPDSEQAHFNAGLAAARLEKWSEAAGALGRAIALNPGRAESYLNHGIALQYLESYPQAIEALETALEMQPDLIQSHYYLYVCYRNTGDAEAAARHLARYNEAAKPAGG